MPRSETLQTGVQWQNINLEAAVDHKSIRGMFKILQTLNYTVHSNFLPKFATFVLFTLISDIPAIILKTPCCHAVMTSEIPL